MQPTPQPVVVALLIVPLQATFFREVRIRVYDFRIFFTGQAGVDQSAQNPRPSQAGPSTVQSGWKIICQYKTG
jgi:hypothetical protein